MQAVARAAGVATSTVSRYLKGELVLVEDTEQRVLDAMQELGYSPNARRGASRPGAEPASETRVIGVLLPSFGDNYYARFAEAVVGSAEAHGYDVVIASTGSHVHQARNHAALFHERSVRGLISINTPRTRSGHRFDELGDLPVVVVDEELDGSPNRLIVEADNYSGSRQIITYLTRLGHERIAFISGPRELRSVSERRRGYEDGMRAAGLSWEDQFDLVGECSDEFGFAALSQLLEYSKHRPTAAYVAADEIAIGVLAAASHLQVRVPEDLSVVGFDDIDIARYVSPALTTVRTPIDKLATTAVARLVDAMESQGRIDLDRVVLPVSLVVRQSAAPPRTS